MGLCAEAFEKLDLQYLNQCFREDDQAIWFLLATILLALATATLLRIRVRYLELGRPLRLEVGPSAFRFGQKPNKSTSGNPPPLVDPGDTPRKKKPPKTQKRKR